MAAARAAKKTGASAAASVAAPTAPTAPQPTAAAVISPSMVTAIRNSPKGKIPAGLAKYMASKKAAKKSTKVTKKGK